jgi:hypothetical protein
MGLDGVIRHPTGGYRIDIGWVCAQRDAVGKPCASPCVWRPGQIGEPQYEPIETD